MKRKHGTSLELEARLSEMELVPVYYANRGFSSLIQEGLHKALFPSTHQCNLCALTYGRARVREEWKTLIEKLGIPAEFLHPDDFLRKLGSHPHNIGDLKFQAVFLKTEGNQ